VVCGLLGPCAVDRSALGRPATGRGRAARRFCWGCLSPVTGAPWAALSVEAGRAGPWRKAGTPRRVAGPAGPAGPAGGA